MSAGFNFGGNPPTGSPAGFSFGLNNQTTTTASTGFGLPGLLTNSTATGVANANKSTGFTFGLSGGNTAFGNGTLGAYTTGTLGAPAGTLGASAGTLGALAGTLGAPAGTLGAPAGTLGAPTGTLGASFGGGGGGGFSLIGVKTTSGSTMNTSVFSTTIPATGAFTGLGGNATSGLSAGVSLGGGGIGSGGFSFGGAPTTSSGAVASGGAFSTTKPAAAGGLTVLGGNAAFGASGALSTTTAATTVPTSALSGIGALGGASAGGFSGASFGGGGGFSLSGTSTTTTGDTAGTFSLAKPATSALTSSATGVTVTSNAPSVGFNLPSSSLPVATTTTAASQFSLTFPGGSISVPTATSTSISLTATASSGTTAPSMNYRQLEEAINKWTIELEEQESVFIDQATQVNAWDRLLLENGDMITQLNQDVQRVKSDQQRLDQELDFILGQQNELEDVLKPLELTLGQLPPVIYQQHSDLEREHTYKLAENVDTQLKRMASDLKEIIEHLNASNASQDNNDPLIQIAKILNAHMNSLQWIDQKTGVLQRRAEDVARQHRQQTNR